MALPDLQTYMLQAIQANEAGDLDTALSKLDSAQMVMLAMPSTVVHAAEQITFNNQINALRDRIQQKQNSKVGITFTEIEYLGGE